MFGLKRKQHIVNRRQGCMSSSTCYAAKLDGIKRDLSSYEDCKSKDQRTPVSNLMTFNISTSSKQNCPENPVSTFLSQKSEYESP